MNLDPLLRDVYAEHGLAMAEAQLLEQYLRHCILAITVRVGSGRFDADAAELSEQTLGNLIQRFEKIVDVPAAFRGRLAAARHLRNWLAHSYFSDRADYLQSDDGRSKLVRELDEISEEFYLLWGYLDAAIVGWLAGPDHAETALIGKLTVLVHEES